MMVAGHFGLESARDSRAGFGDSPKPSILDASIGLTVGEAPTGARDSRALPR